MTPRDETEARRQRGEASRRLCSEMRLRGDDVMWRGEGKSGTRLGLNCATQACGDGRLHC